MTTLSLNCCWIAPNGAIHPVMTHQHGKFANEVLGQQLPSEYAIYELARNGWLHIGFSQFVSVIRYAELPDSQVESLYAVLRQVTSGVIEENILSYIHS